MPGGDRTGPRGMGPMTGGAAGYCAGYAGPGYARPGLAQRYGFGPGYGIGGGRGWRNMYYANGLTGWARYRGYSGFGPYADPYGDLDLEIQKQELKNRADALEAELNLVQRRISDLESRVEAE
jgi:hypothetical protein